MEEREGSALQHLLRRNRVKRETKEESKYREQLCFNLLKLVQTVEERCRQTRTRLHRPRHLLRHRVNNLDLEGAEEEEEEGEREGEGEGKLGDLLEEIEGWGY